MPPDDPMLSAPIRLFFRKKTKLAKAHAVPNCAGFRWSFTEVAHVPEAQRRKRICVPVQLACDMPELPDGREWIVTRRKAIFCASL